MFMLYRAKNSKIFLNNLPPKTEIFCFSFRRQIKIKNQLQKLYLKSTYFNRAIFWKQYFHYQKWLLQSLVDD